MKEKVGKEKKGLRYIFEVTHAKKIKLGLAILCSVISGIAVFVPYLMVFQTILFIFEGSAGTGDIVSYVIIVAIATVIRFVFQGASIALTHINAYEVLNLVRKRLCEHIGKVNLGFFTNTSSGEIKKVLMEDVEKVEQLLAHLIPDLVVAMIVPAAVFLYLLSVNVPMALFLIVPIVLIILAQIIMVALAGDKMKQYSEAEGRMNSAIMQFINGMPVMKIYDLTADSYDEYSNTVANYNRIYRLISKLAAPPSAVAKIISEAGVLWTLPLGGYLVLTGRMDVGGYVFFMIMSIVFLSSFMKLYNFAHAQQQITAGIGHIKRIMDIPAMADGDTRLGKIQNYDVEFQNVSFAYEQEQVLRDVNIHIPHGGFTAFVGASGAGKTTAAQLIPRFWDVSEGHITVGGKDICDIRYENLMDMVSFVFQEAFLLNDTIYQNIAVGKDSATRQEVERVAKAAQIHDFIMELPNGYDTHIGAKGVKLSGGEKQRICIARAILKDAPVIVFDEATSFTDMENEYKIQLALNELLKEKTVIMIAHRLHTIIHADQICVFESGRVKESGTHNALIKENGLYASMWKSYTRQELGGQAV